MSDGWELDDDELSLLTPDERAEYDRLLAEVRRFGPKWTLTQVPKANRMHLLAGKVDWVLGGGSVGGGKALDLDTPIPTPTGWVTMGELRVGDEVIHPKSGPTRVVAATEVMVGRPCYRVDVETPTGWRPSWSESIVADAEHLWPIVDADGRRRLVRTEELGGLLHAVMLAWIPVGGPVSRHPGADGMLPALNGPGAHYCWFTVTPVPSVPVRCITVSADDGLYLCGRNKILTHNSEAMAYHALDLAKTIPGSQSLILRSSLPELRRSFIIRTMVRFAQTGDDKRAKLAQRDNVRGWWFDNGSIIEFGFLSREEHAGQFLSAEYDFQGFDESTQLPSKAITMVTGRLRTTVAKAALGSRPHAMFCSNPGDISHEWHKEVFIDPTEYGRNVVVFDIYDGFMDDDGRVDWDKAKIVEVVPAPQTVEEVEAFTLDTDPSRHLSVAFIPFSAIDNPYLDASVMRGLNALPEMERRQKRDGDWDAFTGRYFPEFGTVHIVEPFDVPMSWDHGIGIDHGYTAPFAAVFGAWDNDGNCYIYDEVYQTKLTPPQQAREVLSRLERIDKSGKPVRQRVRTPVADPSVFNEKGEGMSVAQQWAAAGLHTIPANNSRIDGWMNVREYLRVPVTEDGVGKPKLFIFSTCHNLIREFRNARQDPRRPDDVDTTGSDHAADGCRYLLATRPRRWRRKGSTVDWSKSTLERLEAAHLDRLAKRRTRL